MFGVSLWDIFGVTLTQSSGRARAQRARRERRNQVPWYFYYECHYADVATKEIKAQVTADSILVRT